MSDSQEHKTADQVDREWLENVYQGDKVPQLTTRAVISGMLLGGIMSLSNLYVGLKSGWGLGVDIVAVILIYSIFKGLKSAGLVKNEFGMMENTIMMTVAVAASWISSAGLVSAVPALSMLTGYQWVWWQLTLYIGSILFLGLFMAIPFKRQMISVDQLKFPGNIPTGETIKAMYSKGTEAITKAKALGVSGGIGMVIAGLRDGLAWIPGQFNIPTMINRVSMGKLTLSFEPSLIFIGIGALFGIKIGLSMLLGLVLNYGVLAPAMINEQVISHAAPQIRAAEPARYPYTTSVGQGMILVLEEATMAPEMSQGTRVDTLRYLWTQPATYQNNKELTAALNNATLFDGTPNPFFGKISVRDTIAKAGSPPVLFIEATKSNHWEAKLTLAENQPDTYLKPLGFKPGGSSTKLVGGFRSISAWSLWPGATMLVVSGLLSLAFQWKTLGKTFASIFKSFGKKNGNAKHILDDIEVPMSWFIPGFVITGILSIILQITLFSIHWYMGIISVLLTFILAAVATRAGAEIGINPIGALGKVTQLTYGVLAPGNIQTNLMTAMVTAGASASCSDTVGNLYVGHMVGANPRKQFIAQIFGVIAGAFMAVPAYFILVPDPSTLGGDKFPAPSALVWAGVAKVLSQGLNTLPRSAVIAMGIAFVLAIAIVLIERMFPKIRPYTPSATALAISFTIPAYTSFSMFLGALIAWVLAKKYPKTDEMYTIPVASGVIAGESIMGVILAGLIAFGILE